MLITAALLFLTQTALASSTELPEGVDGVMGISGIPSRNYDALTYADDGRAIITHPRFSMAAGKTLSISMKTDMSGTCLLFGLGKAIDATGTTDTESNVVINVEGRFAAFYPQIAGQGFGNRIQQLMCELHESLPRPAVKPYANASSIKHYDAVSITDDGRMNFINPRFRYGNGDWSYFSMAANLDAVCAHFNSGPAVVAGMQWDYTQVSTVFVEGTGRFSRKGHSAGIRSQYIRNLMCESTHSPVPRLAKHTQNDDGSYTLEALTYFGPGNQFYAIENRSLDGVCRRFGFRDPIASSVVLQNSAAPKTVGLGDDGRMVSINVTQVIPTIQSLICRNKL